MNLGTTDSRLEGYVVSIIEIFMNFMIKSFGFTFDLGGLEQINFDHFGPIWDRNNR